MVGTAGTVLVNGAAKLGHGHYGYIILVSIHVIPEGNHAAAQVGNVAGNDRFAAD